MRRPLRSYTAGIRDERNFGCTTYDSVEFLDTPGSIIDRSHSDEAKPSGAIRLLRAQSSATEPLGIFETDPLIIYNSNFLDSTETTELFVEVAFLCTDAEAENTENIGRIRGLWGFR